MKGLHQVAPDFLYMCGCWICAKLPRDLYFNESNKPWKTREGTFIQPQDLEDSHILNIIRMFRRSLEAENIPEKLHPVWQQATIRDLDHYYLRGDI